MARGRKNRGGRRNKRPGGPVGFQSAQKLPYQPINGVGLTTSQLRGEPVEEMLGLSTADLRGKGGIITRTQRRRAQRAGANGKIAQIGSDTEFSLVTDLRKTINLLQGRPSDAPRMFDQYRRRLDSDDTENSEFSTKREEILHTRTKPEFVPSEEKKLWNARKPNMVRRAQQKQLTTQNTIRNAEHPPNTTLELTTRRRSVTSSHIGSHKSDQTVTRRVKTRNTSNELLMSDIDDADHDYYGSRHHRPPPTRVKREEKFSSDEDVRETDILSLPPVTRRRSSTMLTRYSVQNETAVVEPEPEVRSHAFIEADSRHVEPEVILPPPKNLPPADIQDGSIIAFLEAGIVDGVTKRPAHSKTLINQVTRHIYQQ